jgi:hypothetical protein
MAPRRPLPVPTRPAERANASPPMTAPIKPHHDGHGGRDSLGGQGVNTDGGLVRDLCGSRCGKPEPPDQGGGKQVGDS